MGNWADMVPDILLLIARRLYLYRDYVIFGGVCGTWRFVATKDNFNNLHLHLPRLMLSENKDDLIHREFYSLPDQQIHKVVLPEVSGKRCCSTQGWIFTLGMVGDVNLLHPATRSVVPLPNLQTFPDLDRTFPNFEEEGGFDGEYMQSMFIEKVALSTSDPCALTSTNNNFIVMVIYGSTSRLGFYKGGDDGWSMVHTFQSAFFDVIYHRGLFYAVDCQGRLYACDPTATTTTITAEFISVWPAHTLGIEKLYLVASSSGDKLLIISREGIGLDEEDNYETTRFQVFQFERQQNTNNIDNGGGKWEEVESIGDEAIFLGDNCSVSINVYDESIVGCKANCIYFTDDCVESYHQLPSGGGRDMGVYHLKDGSFEPHFKGQSYSIISPPLWVMSTLLPPN